jgi:tellurite resistance protein TehA-like permease
MARLLLGWVDDRVRALYPGAFAFVMATGIVSVGAVQAGRPALSWALFAVGAAVFLTLVVLFVVRGCEVRRVEALTFVAGSGVLGARLALAGDVRPAVALGAVAAVAWAALLAPTLDHLARQREARTSGSALLAVVAPESLAVLGAILGRRLDVAPLTLAAEALWAVGLLAYALLAPGVCVRLLRVSLTRGSGRGDDWVAMGALAIATVAASELELGHAALGLWVAATVVLPLVLAAELRAGPRRYESQRWATVFPLGMYAVASYKVGAVDASRLLGDLGLAAFWVALAAWALTALATARRLRA